MNDHVKLQRNLSLWPMVMLGLGYLTPAVVFDTYGLSLHDSQGHVPSTYVLTLIAMLFTAQSYGKMVRVYPTAGSSYTYAQKTIGPRTGFLVGWASLLDYLLLPMINVLLAQQYLSAIFPGIPPWSLIIIISCLVTAVNLRGMKDTAGLNSLFVYFQFSVIIVFIIFCIKAVLSGVGLGEVFTLKPFYSETFHFPSIVAGATVLCFSFLGFDAVSNYTEEAINPERDVPKAIMLTALIGGAIFIFTSYFTQIVFPDYRIFADYSNSTAADISFHVGGKSFQVIFLAASLVGVLASGLASHASVSRLLYVMGRDGSLPKRFFGYLSPQTHLPLYNILFVGIFCFSAVFFNVENAVHAISFGSLVAFSFVNISVIARYAIHDKKINTRSEILFNVIMPLCGLLIILGLWYNIKNLALLFGGVWLILGFVVFQIKGSRPQI